jgi:hypothetical protein
MNTTFATKSRTPPTSRVTAGPVLVPDPFALPTGRRARRAESLASGLLGRRRRRTISLAALVGAIRGDTPAVDDWQP